MATRLGATLLGGLTGYAVYFALNRQVNDTTAQIERRVGLVGYQIHLLRAKTGVPVEAGGVILPPQRPAPLHQRPPVPPESDPYYDAISTTLIHKWNQGVRKAHSGLLNLLIQQTDSNSSNSQQSSSTPSRQ